MKKDFIKLSGILCAITLVAAVLLAFVNNITAEHIEIAAKEASESAMRSILSEADSFENIDENIAKGTKNGNTVGYCVTVSPSGFGGPVEMMVGIGEDGVVKGIEILSHSETAGLGAKAATDDFKNRFKEKSTELEVVKTVTENPEEVQAITGATITSKAVAKGVKEASDMLENAKKGGSN